MVRMCDADRCDLELFPLPIVLYTVGMMQTDEELVRLHLAGDPDAFAALVTRHLPLIYGLAYRSTGDEMEAENIAQEVFARAYAALPRSREVLSFRAWLLTIAVNLCRNWIRRTRRQPAVDAGLPGGEEDVLGQVPDPGPRPLEALLQGEVTSELEKAVEELPLAYRQAIILRYVEGLSYQELAQALGLPLNTVRTHLYRAKERLRQALVQVLEGENDGLRKRAAAPGSLPGRTGDAARGATGPRASDPVLGLPD